MGAGASVDTVAGEVASLGPAYRKYAVAITENGVDGALLSSLNEPAELDETMEALGVTNGLHRRKLSITMRERALLSNAGATVATGAPPVAAVAEAVPVSDDSAGGRAPSLWTLELVWSAALDLDLAAAVFTDDGTLLALCYHATQEVLGRALVHSGDARGDRTGGAACRSHREVVTARLGAIDARAAAVVFFVLIHDGGAAAFADVGAATLSATGTSGAGGDATADSAAEHTLFPLQATDADCRSAALCRLVRVRGGGAGARGRWRLDSMQWADPTPRLDLALRPARSLLRDALPGVVEGGEERAVVLEKRAIMPLCGADLTLGLGWDPVDGGKGSLDLDAGCVLLDRDNIYVDFVYFDNLVSSGMRHSGDNRTGAGDGDDETIHFDLTKIPPNVESIVVVISCFSGDLTRVRNAFARVVDCERARDPATADSAELCRFDIGGQFNATSLIVCKLYRDIGFWKVQVIGTPINGRSVVEFFYLDTSGPMADLRHEFKEKAACPYSDTAFFAAMQALQEQGVAPASTDKD